ncbi:MAG: glycine cleavage system aminomethyltransferase GcvT [Bacteriovoracaceae bacterium]
MKKTSLYDKHTELKAKLGDFAGFQMPLQYSSVQEEVKAVRNSVGVFDVSHMGEFLVTGPETNKFVNYMITNDFTNLPLLKAVYSPLCKEDGGILDDLIAYKIEEQRAMICVNASNLEKDWNWFQKHAEKFDVNLTNISDSVSLLAIQGPEAITLLKDKLNLDIPEGSFSLNAKDSKPSSFNLIARTGYTGEDGVEIFADHNFISDLWEKLMDNNVTPCGLVARDVLRTEACFPLYGQELTEDITPLDVGLKWTVKLEGDDFCSKESLLKAEPKYKSVKLQIEKGIPRQGYSIWNKGEKVGSVTSGTFSPTFAKGIAMGLVNSNVNLKEGEFEIEIRGKNVPATRVTKSFLKA